MLLYGRTVAAGPWLGSGTLCRAEVKLQEQLASGGPRRRSEVPSAFIINVGPQVAARTELHGRLATSVDEVQIGAGQAETLCDLITAVLVPMLGFRSMQDPKAYTLVYQDQGSWTWF